MQRCLQLAIKGLGKTYPNPLVGCVIVNKGRVIGEGWHKKAGTPHAEVHAIESVEEKNLLSESTLYVNLEPCNHHGKTPPCVDLILKHNIKRVVIGSLDPNPLVSGSGMERLKENGCRVIKKVLAPECDWINRRFFTYHQKKRPYITLKWAESVEGYIAPSSSNRRSVFYLSDSYSQQLVHRWRSEEHAILVGSTTVKKDNPKLNVRRWAGNNPIPIVLDPNDTLDESDQIVENKKMIAITRSIIPLSKTNNSFDLNEVLTYLYQQGIQSILVEGGLFTLQQFIDHHLWDTTRLLKTSTCLSNGVKAPKFGEFPYQKISLDNDELWLFKNME